MEGEAWTILDSLELEDIDRTVVERLLELLNRTTVSCNPERCVFYSTIQASSDALKRLPFAPLSDTPVLLYSGERVTAVGLVVPPYVHVVLVIKRTQSYEPA